MSTRMRKALGAAAWSLFLMAVATVLALGMDPHTAIPWIALGTGVGFVSEYYRARPRKVRSRS